MDISDHVPYNPTEVAEMVVELGRNGGAAFPRDVDPDEGMRAVEEFREGAVAYATAVEKYGGHDLQTESRAADDIVQKAVLLVAEVQRGAPKMMPAPKGQEAVRRLTAPRVRATAIAWATKGVWVDACYTPPHLAMDDVPMESVSITPPGWREHSTGHVLG